MYIKNKKDYSKSKYFEQYEQNKKNYKEKVNNVSNKLTRKKALSPDELYNEWINYEEVCKCNDEIPDISGFVIYAGISAQTLLNYSRNDEYLECVDYINNSWKNAMIQKGYNSSNSRFVEFMLKNRHSSEFKDSKEITTNNDSNLQLTKEEREAKQIELVTKLLKVNPELLNKIVKDNAIMIE